MSKTIYPMSGPLALSGHFSGKVSFSRGVKVDVGTLLFISGALATDEHSNLVGTGDMGAQTRQVLRNLEALLKEAGATFEDVVKVTVFVKDISQFRAIHDARLEFFHPDYLPASTMVEVSGFVHPDALIEIEAYAVIPTRTRSRVRRKSKPALRASKKLSIKTHASGRSTKKSSKRKTRRGKTRREPRVYLDTRGIKKAATAEPVHERIPALSRN